MQATVKIPGVGPVKTQYAIAGGALIVGIVAYAYWSRSRQAATDPAAQDPNATDPNADTSGTDTSGTDTSGMEVTGTDYSGYSDGSASTYQAPYTTYISPTSVTAPSTNGEWDQSAQQVLTDRGVDARAASDALGRYLSGLCMSSAQAGYIREATGAIGNPPQGSFSITICPAAGTTTTPTTGTSTPAALKAPAHLKAAGVFNTHITLTWDKVTGAEGYIVYRDGARVTTVTYPTATVWGLKPSTRHTFKVAPERGAAAGPSASVTATTKK